MQESFTLLEETGRRRTERGGRLRFKGGNDASAAKYSLFSDWFGVIAEKLEIRNKMVKDAAPRFCLGKAVLNDLG